MKKGMVVRSEITELRRVLYDNFIEDNPTNNDKSVHDNQFDYVQNGITVCCKTQLAKGLHIAEVNLDTCCSLTNTSAVHLPIPGRQRNPMSASSFISKETHM